MKRIILGIVLILSTTINAKEASQFQTPETISLEYLEKKIEQFEKATGNNVAYDSIVLNKEDQIILSNITLDFPKNDFNITSLKADKLITYWYRGLKLDYGINQPKEIGAFKIENFELTKNNLLFFIEAFRSQISKQELLEINSLYKSFGSSDSVGFDLIASFEGNNLTKSLKIYIELVLEKKVGIKINFKIKNLEDNYLEYKKFHETIKSKNHIIENYKNGILSDFELKFIGKEMGLLFEYAKLRFKLTEEEITRDLVKEIKEINKIKDPKRTKDVKALKDFIESVLFDKNIEISAKLKKPLEVNTIIKNVMYFIFSPETMLKSYGLKLDSKTY
jgi:hypothetical protein